MTTETVHYYLEGYKEYWPQFPFASRGPFVELEISYWLDGFVTLEKISFTQVWMFLLLHRCEKPIEFYDEIQNYINSLNSEKTCSL